MKKYTGFICKQLSLMDTAALRIFTLTRRTFDIMLLVSLVLLLAAPLCTEGLFVEQLASALFHASFRVAVIGAVTGFIADIVIRREK